MPFVTKFQRDSLFSLEEFLQQLVHAFLGVIAGVGVTFAEIKRHMVTIRRAVVANKFFLFCIAVCLKGKTKLIVNSYSPCFILLKKSKTERYLIKLF